MAVQLNIVPINMIRIIVIVFVILIIITISKKL